MIGTKIRMPGYHTDVWVVLEYDSEEHGPLCLLSENQEIVSLVQNNPDLLRNYKWRNANLLPGSYSSELLREVMMREQTRCCGCP